ncbi:hypothetical protein DSM3645_11636 [Blastopirellula marina DSM 3645]|uniref:DUF1559 domain-containing protein n=1 Tax=Blastopirellula marina DSM 3645 TaxID=314230 RepID=A4A2U0_9BACT|nr:hypothetical protein DSM3645_11636 [Blastopirellula marina DSM 3645]
MVELLVVIAIIGVLIALLLPAVQQAREAARRIQCSGNLKQLGLAMHNYHDVNRSLPIGYYGDQTGDGWIKGLLPYLEQNAMADIWLEDKNYNDGSTNETVVCNTRLSILTCPSDTPASWYHTIPQYNYAVNLGNTSTFRSSPLNGVTFAKGPFHNENDHTMPSTKPCITYGLRDITDGTSNTLMMMEVRQGMEKTDLRGLTWWGPGSGVSAHYGPNSTSPDVLSSGFCVTNPLQGMPCTGTGATLFSSRSQHPGGAQAVMCDASVQFYPETIDVAAWRSMGTMQNGEVVISP